MNKQLSPEEAAELRAGLKNNAKKRDKYTFEMFRSDAKATWNGLVKLVRFVSELTVGASAVITLAAAYKFVQSTTYPRPVIQAMTFAVVLMAVIAMTVLGRYLIQKGRK